jgi:FtsP/CotA-like multicopper oxidase with cupredoxin domain
MVAAVPALRPRPTLGMKDMGMMDHGAAPAGDAACPPEHAAMGHCTPAGGAPAAPMKHDMRDKSLVPAGVKVGVGVDMIAPMPVDRTGDRPLGLEDEAHRVLTYHQLAPLVPFPDTRAPTRSVDIHLTGNMERFMWSFDGKKLNEGAEPIRFERNERVRVNLINNSMMNHPIHIHGHFFELVTGQAHGHPVKHTVNVMPGGKASFDLTADAAGDWAFHCHLLLHMHAGMMNVVKVRPMDPAPVAGDAA